MDIASFQPESVSVIRSFRMISLVGQRKIGIVSNWQVQKSVHRSYSNVLPMLKQHKLFTLNADL